MSYTKPTKYSDVDLENLSLAQQPTKLANSTVVPFNPPLRVQTELLTATTSLCDDNGHTLTSLKVRATGNFLRFLKKFEDAILKAAKQNSSTWFTRNPTPELIENGFKSYFEGDDTIRIDVPASIDARVFNENSEPTSETSCVAGTRFWAVLEARRVALGRQEFGMVWRLSQIMIKNATSCQVTAMSADVEDESTDLL